jgi:parallel beta-helix repeat protein
VTNSEFQQLRFGIQHLDSNYLNFSGNYFHDIRTDGIRGGGSSPSHDHQQLLHELPTDGWRPRRRHPVLDQQTHHVGDGHHDHAATPICAAPGLRPRASSCATKSASAPYKNVTITNNLVVGSEYHGITMSSTVGGVISGNEVVGLPDLEDLDRSVANSTDVALTNNGASSYVMVGNTNVIGKRRQPRQRPERRRP